MSVIVLILELQLIFFFIIELPVDYVLSYQFISINHLIYEMSENNENGRLHLRESVHFQHSVMQSYAFVRSLCKVFFPSR